MCVWGCLYLDDGECQDKHVWRRCAALSPNGHISHFRDPAVGRIRRRLSQGKDSAYDALKMSVRLEEDFPVGAAARKGQDAVHWPGM